MYHSINNDNKYSIMATKDFWLLLLSYVKKTHAHSFRESEEKKKIIDECNKELNRKD